jgi:hypothetical protein
MSLLEIFLASLCFGATFSFTAITLMLKWIEKNPKVLDKAVKNTEKPKPQSSNSDKPKPMCRRCGQRKAMWVEHGTLGTPDICNTCQDILIGLC